MAVLLIDFMKGASVIKAVNDYDVLKVISLIPSGALVKISGFPLGGGISEMYVVAQGVVKLFRHWANDHVNLIYGLDLSQPKDLANVLKGNYSSRVVVEDYSETYRKEGSRAMSSIEMIQEDFGPCLDMTRVSLVFFPHPITQLVQEYLFPMRFAASELLRV